MRKDKAVWWRASGKDKYGKDKYDSPVEIACRWEDQMGQYFNSRGESNNSKATVYVDRQMTPGDVLKHGPKDSSTLPLPTTDTRALPIQAFDVTPSLDYQPGETLYVAHL